ncbi:hypothetical protein GSI_06402 [Ganoderma sinense ZZ0214-1]|uniref:N-acetyltransferase domain-containing protein n=1 Tax=Ganoderma sinense ZZ0214-1 TaxID=1077348 RepID=A0A2G8SD57_9APHY|nr:hypothetical protein GSI_06402 [Ganoderma sinense ZZ0214-1]
MPSNQSTFSISITFQASRLPSEVWASFRENPHASNIMFAYASKAAKFPHTATGENVWIVLWDTPDNRSSPSVTFVLSCTTGPLGPYPVFIYTPLSSASLKHAGILPKLLAIARALKTSVPPERVFSIFAVDSIASTFADIWTTETGIPLATSPQYYHASLMCCDANLLRLRPLPSLSGADILLRPAVTSDIANVSRLCHAFAAGSEPFVLSNENAIREATIMIQNNHLWVHEVRPSDREPEIASIVAATRTTDTVAAITKVFTNPKWRSRGCAERLLRHVCQQLLKEKATIILYVAHDNPAALSVYRNVGFVGFTPYSGGRMNESWKELGFDRSRVELGHW